MYVSYVACFCMKCQSTFNTLTEVKYAQRGSKTMHQFKVGLNGCKASLGGGVQKYTYGHVYHQRLTNERLYSCSIH